MFSSKVKIAALALIAGITASSQAQAITIVQSASFGPAPTDYNGTGAGSALLRLFDTSLGTLNSVTIVTSYGFNSSITLVNVGATQSIGTARTESAARFGSTNANINTALNMMVNRLGSVTVARTTLNPAAYDLNGPSRPYVLPSGTSTMVDSSAAVQNLNSGAFADNTILSAFSGNGVNLFNAQLFTATGAVLNSAGGDVIASQMTTAAGSFQLTYDYTAGTAAPTSAVPEPASWAMMIGGFGIAGGSLRRRRKLSTKASSAA